MEEIWKDIINYIGLYMISNYGRIKSFKDNHGNYREKIWEPNSHQEYGHSKISLWKNNRIKSRWIHRLVLETFIGPCPPGMECRHLDGNPQNNRLNNLKWGTPKENQADRILHGTDHRGSRCPTAKLTDVDIPKIRKLIKDGVSCAKIGKLFGVSGQAISKIKNNISWRE